ncbi:MAG: FAD-binding oxidoreductase [Bacillota bacterium]
MQPAIISELITIVGKENVYTSFEDLFCYTYDASFVPVSAENVPGAAVYPGSAGEVAEVLKLAYREKIPVIPRGAGTNVSGGTLPARDCIVMVLTRMNRILEIDQANLIAVVEPGVVTAHLQREVEKLGLFYPPDPASQAYSTLGGNVAECAGGPRGVKYGVTKDYVLGLEVVLPTGEIMETGGRTVKNVAGYDLTKLFTGSEGTLGVITRITLKLLPLPEAKKTLLVVFDQIEQAAEAVSGIIAGGIIPTTLELLDNVYIRNIEEYAKVGFPVEAEAVLLIEVDGDSEVIDKEARKIKTICEELGAVQVRVANTKEEAEELWRARRSAFAAVARINPTIIGEDVTVPRTNIPAMVKEIQAIARKYSVIIAVVGHAGDGNLHATFLCDERNEEEMNRVEQAVKEVLAAALRLGGTLTGEHGIGRMKAKFLPDQLGNVSYQVMKSIKQALDPAGILNPGVMFKE